jgi:hypothetical protein
VQHLSDAFADTSIASGLVWEYLVTWVRLGAFGLDFEGERSMRRAVVVMVVTALAVSLAPQSALAAKPSRGCPPSFDLGGLTLELALQLPNIQAALADGVDTIEGLTAAFETLDINGDGIVCFQSYSSNANEMTLQQYAYNAADNNASVPSG